MKAVRLIVIMLGTVLLAACAHTYQAKPENTAYAGVGFTEKQLLEQNTILFGFDKYEVDDSYNLMLEAHARYLKAHPDSAMLIAGNTDERGSREYNLGLGERRANAVEAVLLANGAKPDQLVKVSYGSEIPVACGKEESAFAQNRRVDLLNCQSNTCKVAAKNYAKNILCTQHS